MLTFMSYKHLSAAADLMHVGLHPGEHQLRLDMFVQVNAT